MAEDEDAHPDVSDIEDLEQDSDMELTPLKTKHGALHHSDEEGFYDDDFQLSNTKHYANNDRLAHKDVVAHLKRQSPRLSATKSKTDNPKLVKNRTAKKSSGKVLPTTDNDASGSEQEKEPGKREKTAFQRLDETSAKRKLQWEAKLKAAAEKREADEKRERSRLEIERRNRIKTMKDTTGSTAAERKAHMLSNTEQRAHERQTAQGHTSREEDVYDVALDKIKVPWNKQQGGQFRKEKECDRSRRAKDSTESFMDIVRKKQETLDQLHAELRAPTPDHVLSSAKLSAEQLWADSFVTLLQRIPQDIRDEFQLYCQAAALKAIRGVWPPEWKTG